MASDTRNEADAHRVAFIIGTRGVVFRGQQSAKIGVIFILVEVYQKFLSH
jgi:hypothetical protein